MAVGQGMETTYRIRGRSSRIGLIDVEELLNEWGVTEPLPGNDLMGYRACRHSAAPDFVVHYPLKPELSPATVLSICRALRILHERLTT